MTIFDYLKDILVDKKGSLPLEQYVPYMVNRWISFIHPSTAECVNSYLSQQDLLLDKERHYKMAISIFPKARTAPRITYIKKTKDEKTSEDNKIKQIAEALEISQREASILVDNI